jgi:pimeloyl-ACP methyl ester carboxylesterase
MTGSAAIALSAREGGERMVRVGDAVFTYREAGSGPPLVLLHGIGSAAISFGAQLDLLSADFRVIAWDAPGYGGSTPLAATAPDAGDYAAALDRLLGALGIGRLHLLGHSLGTLIAARFAAEQPQRLLTLTLAGASRGHARLPAAERQRLLAARLDPLAEFGPRGMAERRAPRLFGRDANAAVIDEVVETMARIHPGGYAQAARMLSAADILADIARLPEELPVQVVVGEADAITPPDSNRDIAAQCHAAPCHVIAGAGHMLYLEKPEVFNRLLRDFLMPQGEAAGSPAI